MKTVTLALVGAALAGAAPATAAAAPPKLVGTPFASYKIVDGAVSIGATVRLDRRFADTTEMHRYSLVAAPHLERGRRLPDALFGGTALGRFAARPGAWYRAEAQQLHKRTAVKPGARWQLALASGGRIVGVVKTVRLRRAY
jgi:hypothetical protein